MDRNTLEVAWGWQGRWFRRKLGVTVNEHTVSFGGDENILILIVMMVV